MSTPKLSAPDLTQRPPRSPRTRLGGYVLLPRMLDKGRATLAGTNGEYHYNCPLDQHVIKFIGFTPMTIRNCATGSFISCRSFSQAYRLDYSHKPGPGLEAPKATLSFIFWLLRPSDALDCW